MVLTTQPNRKEVDHLKCGYNCRDLSWIHQDLPISQEMKPNETERSPRGVCLTDECAHLTPPIFKSH